LEKKYEKSIWMKRLMWYRLVGNGGLEDDERVEVED
jgi:hypothetical protein